MEWKIPNHDRYCIILENLAISLSISKGLTVGTYSEGICPVVYTIRNSFLQVSLSPTTTNLEEQVLNQLYIPTALIDCKVWAGTAFGPPSGVTSSAMGATCVMGGLYFVKAGY